MIDEIKRLFERIAQLEHIVHNQVRHGSVHEVDPKKQQCRVRFGGTDEEPFLSPWVPYSQMAGAFKGHVPVSKGQNVTMFAPSGDWRQAVAVPMTFSNSNQSPGQTAEENVWTFGAVRVAINAGAFVVSVGGSTFTVNAASITSTNADMTMVVKKGGTTIQKKKVIVEEDVDSAGDQMQTQHNK